MVHGLLSYPHGCYCFCCAMLEWNATDAYVVISSSHFGAHFECSLAKKTRVSDPCALSAHSDWHGPCVISMKCTHASPSVYREHQAKHMHPRDAQCFCACQCAANSGYASSHVLKQQWNAAKDALRVSNKTMSNSS